MIRYPLPPGVADLEQLIEARVPGWLARAKERTKGFMAARMYDEASSIWGEVKPVYVDLQQDKCAYCERRLSSPDYGLVEHDMEHYRPKNTVEAWPTPAMTGDGRTWFAYPTGRPRKNGYYWLAYHPLNYCAACKTCNTPLKSNYFPVPAGRSQPRAAPAKLNTAENPFLIYPIGNLDEDPEDLITFVGTAPVPAVPVATDPGRHRRAEVTIRFFELDTREDLQRERAEQFEALESHLAIINGNHSPADQAVAKRKVERMQSPGSRHSACVKAVCRLYVADPAKARELFAAASRYLDKVG